MQLIIFVQETGENEILVFSVDHFTLFANFSVFRLIENVTEIKEREREIV